MMKEGILHVIGDIIVSETDPLILVCLPFFSFFKALSLLVHPLLQTKHLLLIPTSSTF